MDPLRISIVGLSTWESVFVQTSVDLASGMELPTCRFVEDPERADVLLVDADHRRYVPVDDGDNSSGPVVVSITEDPGSKGAGRDLQRPVGYTKLISMLKDIEQQLHGPGSAVQAPQPASRERVRPEPARPPPKEPDPAVTAKIPEDRWLSTESLADKDRPARRFVEGTRLLGVLSRISRWGIAAEVSHPRFPTLLINPNENTFVASADPLTIPGMFRDSAMSFSIDDLADDVAQAVLTSGRLRPLSHLIYCAALFGSEGRPMLNSNLKDRLSLIGTPDFDAVPHLPQHKTIARYLVANAADLAEIAHAAGTGIDIVIDFCNACEAIGLVRRIPDTGATEHVDEHGVLQLFGRVRDLFREP